MENVQNTKKKWYEILEGKIINITKPEVTDFHLSKKLSRFKLFGIDYKQVSFGKLIKFFEKTISEEDKKNFKLFCLVIFFKEHLFSKSTMIYPIFKISNGFHCGMYTSIRIPEMKNNSRNFKEFEKIEFDLGYNCMKKLKDISKRIDETKFVKSYIIN